MIRDERHFLLCASLKRDAKLVGAVADDYAAAKG